MSVTLPQQQLLLESPIMSGEVAVPGDAEDTIPVAHAPGMQDRGAAHRGRSQPGALQDRNHHEGSTRRRGQRLTLKDR